jgi:hypothetical protein
VDINDIDKAAYEVPDTDEGYLKILKERFERMHWWCWPLVAANL